ncbi:LysR family transcriptional regulator [Pseudomonas coronafaciens pv. oryzae]|nr:LysR family transcriptional regulator [Pseudomonas coronafaciens pv. oryzae]RMS98751.1 LysR family transcriptional regulator [Pseudomonas coronafaciens pv. oryzae]
MAVNNRIDSSRLAMKCGSRRILACSARPTLAVGSKRGIDSASNTAIKPDSRVNAQNAPRQPTASANTVPSGMPNSIAAEIPRYTCATALPARFGPASRLAVSLAVPQNTGNASAGMNRASASTQILLETAASALEAANISRMTINVRLRSRCESMAVSGGPNSITVKAKSVTSKPAVEIEIPRSRANDGSSPIMRNSVVTITKPAKARIAMDKPAPDELSLVVLEAAVSRDAMIQTHQKISPPAYCRNRFLSLANIPYIVDSDSLMGVYMLSTDRLKGIETFVAVANAGGFTAAAERLNLTNSAVSKSVARLESRLGMRLFERTTRRLTLTEEGAAYHVVCMRMLAELEAAETALAAQRMEPAGQLRIDLPATFGRLHALPLILAFTGQHHKLRPRVTFTDRFVDILEEGIDLAVRIGGPQVWPAGLAHRYLGTERVIFCAAPAYLHRHGTPETFEDLARHACILFGRGDGSTSPWLFVDEQGQQETRAVEARLVIGNGEAQVAAVTSAWGIAQLATWLIKEQLQRGELVEILPQLATQGLDLHLAWPRKRESLPKVQALVELLSDALRVD